MHEIKLAPSIFAADLSNLAGQLRQLEQAGVELLHVDVMDGHFVDRMAFGPDHVRMLKRATSIPLDVHLMVERPERLLDRILEAGADSVTVHQEATDRLLACLQQIHASGARSAVALSPATDVDKLEFVLDELDMILIMTINPGAYGSQRFIASMISKIERASQLIEGRDIDIEVDGSIDSQTIRLAHAAGANVFVSGGYLFKDIAGNVRTLRLALS